MDPGQEPGYILPHPQVWMKDGDTVVIDIEKLGRLENSCRMV